MSNETFYLIFEQSNLTSWHAHAFYSPRRCHVLIASVLAARRKNANGSRTFTCRKYRRKELPAYCRCVVRNVVCCVEDRCSVFWTVAPSRIFHCVRRQKSITIRNRITIRSKAYVLFSPRWRFIMEIDDSHSACTIDVRAKAPTWRRGQRPRKARVTGKKWHTMYMRTYDYLEAFGKARGISRRPLCLSRSTFLLTEKFPISRHLPTRGKPAECVHNRFSSFSPSLYFHRTHGFLSFSRTQSTVRLIG